MNIPLIYEKLILSHFDYTILKKKSNPLQYGSLGFYPKIAPAAVLGDDFSRNACAGDGAGSTLKYF